MCQYPPSHTPINLPEGLYRFGVCATPEGLSSFTGGKRGCDLIIWFGGWRDYLGQLDFQHNVLSTAHWGVHCGTIYTPQKQ